MRLHLGQKVVRRGSRAAAQNDQLGRVCVDGRYQEPSQIMSPSLQLVAAEPVVLLDAAVTQVASAE